MAMRIEKYEIILPENNFMVKFQHMITEIIKICLLTSQKFDFKHICFPAILKKEREAQQLWLT